jgi:ATP-dependent Clp protease ATP-binding subunit ClpB
VDFKNTVIILTSNIGSRFLQEGVTGDTIPETVRESVFAELRRAFRPEFLNRSDDTVLFKPLTLEETTRIVDLLLADLNSRLADRKVVVELDKKAREWVAEKGYDPVYGARPLKRFLQKHVENQLARGLIAGTVPQGSTVAFNVDHDELVLRAA